MNRRSRMEDSAEVAKMEAETIKAPTTELEASSEEAENTALIREKKDIPKPPIEYVVSGTPLLNFREAPNRTAKVLTTVSEGTRLLENVAAPAVTDPEWVAVVYSATPKPHLIGYVMRAFLTEL